MLLNKQNFAKAIKPKSKVIKVGDVEVKIQALSIQEQINLEKANENKDDGSPIFELVRRCCVDDKDECFLDDDMIKSMPGNIVISIFKECLEINNLNEKDIDATAKNS